MQVVQSMWKMLDRPGVVVVKVLTVHLAGGEDQGNG